MQDGLSSPHTPYSAKDSDHFGKIWENSHSSPVLLAAQGLADVQSTRVEIQDLHLLKAHPGAVFSAGGERLHRRWQTPGTGKEHSDIQARGSDVTG